MFPQNMFGPIPWYLQYWYFLRDVISQIPDINVVRVLLIELIMNLLQTQIAKDEFATKIELADAVDTYQTDINDLDTRIKILEEQSLSIRQTAQQRGLCKNPSLPPSCLL